MAFEHWLLPGAILLVKLLLKVLIDRQVDLPEFIEAVLAVPFDIAFIGASLFAALLILKSDITAVDLSLFLLMVAVGIASTFLWRRSSSLFAKDRHLLCSVLFFLNTALTLGPTVIVVRTLSEGSLS